MSLLEIKDLRLYFKTERGRLDLFNGLSLSLSRGEILGIVGESGSGKSTLAYTIIRLLPSNAVITSGSVLFNGTDLLKVPEKEMHELRGKRITMVFQDPATSLNPLFKIREQIVDTIKNNSGITGKEAEKIAINLFRHVELPDPESILECYPFELSGGMQQRVMIALALSSNPDLIIADEPTTAVDATIQIQILKLLKKLRDEHGFSIMLITHSVVAAREICDRIAVMYAGDVVEIGDARKILNDPKHPYTKGLVSSIPRPRRPNEEKKLLASIPGQVPDLTKPPGGCRFHPRCQYAMQKCITEVPMEYAADGRQVRCFLYE